MGDRGERALGRRGSAGNGESDAPACDDSASAPASDSASEPAGDDESAVSASSGTGGSRIDKDLVIERRIRVLAALRAAGTSGVSGETIANELGVSRVAVGKHIYALSALGYVIKARSGAGYVLEAAPNLPLPIEVYPRLEEDGFSDIRLYGGGETGSTNDDCKQLVREGEPEGAVVLAARQTAGKGRLGRKWVSPTGGLYLSELFRPKTTPYHIAPFTLIMGLGIVQAIVRLDSELAPRLSLKWPNDILMDGHKLVGILTEMSTQAECVESLICGIGTNVNRGDDAPDGAAYLSDILGETGLALLAAYEIEETFRLYDEWTAAGFAFAPFAARYRSYLSLLGEDVCVRRMDGSEVASGIVNDIDEQGRLVVGDVPVVAGDVTLRR